MRLRNIFAFVFIVVFTIGGVLAQPTKPTDPAAIAAENEKIKAENAAIQKAFEAGNLAFSKKDYDGAIDIYDAAINAYPTHPGIPTLLTNKAYAQISRGTDVFNAGIANKDDAVRDSGKKYFEAAAATSAKAVALARSLNYTGDQLYSVLLIRKDAMKLIASRIELTVTAEGAAAFNDYLAVETEPAKLEKVRAELGDLYIGAGDVAKAKLEYDKVLAASPKNTAALFGLGNVFLVTGSVHNDKVLYQKSANFFKSFLDLAAANDPKRNDATASLTFLKASYNIVPK